MGRKYSIIWLFFSIQIVVFILIGTLFYFSYQNKSSWDMQTDINDILLKKSSEISSTWHLQLDINEVVMERFRWIGESRSQWKVGESRPRQKIGVKKFQEGEVHED